MGVLGWLRWAWRQLTSMRTALLLLLLLAVAAIPGSVFPQSRTDATAVTTYVAQHGALGEWMQRLGLFEVYSSPWFASIYLLLFVSLIGCVVPRAGVHLRGLRAGPPATPRRLDRLPGTLTAVVDAPPDEVLAAAAAALGRRRYRVRRDDDAVRAQKGALAEAGNLVFHLSLVALLVAVGLGSWGSYSGQVLVVAGQSFSNVVTAYNTFQSGAGVDTGRLQPFTIALRSLSVRFEAAATGAQWGAPRAFSAVVDVASSAGAKRVTLKVNDPLRIHGTNVYLTGNGYAPVITVRDGNGDVVRSGPVIFLPQDSHYASLGVVKVPDALPRQLAFQGLFLPTAYFDDQTGPQSLFPDLANPCLVLSAYTNKVAGQDGLGLDDGTPQSVFSLDTTRLTQITTTLATARAQSAASKCGSSTTSSSASGSSSSSDSSTTAARVLLAPGESMTLPDGLGSVTFDGVRRYVALDVHEDPSRGWALVAALLALAGVTASLYTREFRVWVRARRDEAGRTVVEVAGLAQSHEHALPGELAELLGLVAPAGPRP